MSFSTIEISDDSGYPNRLYSFTLGAAVWRYTSSDADIILGGYRWLAAAISDDGVKLTGEAATDALSITCPSNIAPVNLYSSSTPPSQSILVSIYNYHDGDADFILSYSGELVQVNFPSPGAAQVTCETLSVSMQRDGLRLRWQRACSYALYDPQTCRADKTQHVFDAMIVSATSNTITVSGLDATVIDGTLDGGFIAWDHPQLGTEYRGIEKQLGTNLTMFGLADGLYSGLSIKAYAGCDRSSATCLNKFNNLPNFGGIPDLPGKSPFDGDPVF